jgi:hypothetical protein
MHLQVIITGFLDRCRQPTYGGLSANESGWHLTLCPHGPKTETVIYALFYTLLVPLELRLAFPSLPQTAFQGECSDFSQLMHKYMQTYSGLRLLRKKINARRVLNLFKIQNNRTLIPLI